MVAAVTTMFIDMSLTIDPTTTTAATTESGRPRRAPGPAAADCCVPSGEVEVFAGAGRIAELAKALSDPLRVQIVDLLCSSEQEVCQCELIPRLQITQPLLSHHMRKLVDAGLIEVQRRHRWAYYRVNRAVLAELAGWLG